MKVKDIKAWRRVLLGKAGQQYWRCIATQTIQLNLLWYPGVK